METSQIIQQPKSFKFLETVTSEDSIEIIKFGYPEFFMTNSEFWILENELNLSELSQSLKNNKKDYHFTFYNDKISIYQNLEDDDSFEIGIDNLIDVRFQCYVKAYELGYYINSFERIFNNK